MFQLLRSKFGPVTVSIIIGFISFVFVFFGVYDPGINGGGGGAGGTAATVNGDPISIQDFNRSYEQRIRFYESMMKGKSDPRLLAQLGLKKAVLDDLVRQKVMTQESRKMGFVVSDDEVASKIRELPYFQKDGRFDRDTYEKLLVANGQTPGRFEDALRDDLQVQRLSSFLRDRVKVSPEEIKDEFWANADQRQLDYVTIMLPFESDETKKADSEKKQKELAQQVLEKARAGGGALKAFLKSKNLTQRTTEKFSASQSFIPGIGDVVELKDDAFKADSALAKGPKLYQSRMSFVVAWNLKSFKVTEADFPKQKDRIAGEIQARKERQFFDGWLADAMARSKIKTNDKLMSEELADAR